MKRLFLFFGMAAFGSASAQQKDLFDMNKHIQEYLDKMKTPKILVNPDKPNKYFIPGSTQQGFELSAILPGGDKVYILPADQMPCVVPDMSQFTIMPNIAKPDENFMATIGKQNMPGKIPNPAPPFMILTKEK